jgi:hypothetical protein
MSSHSNYATLTGNQEVPPVATAASGTSDISVGTSKCPSALSSNDCPTMYGAVTTSGIDGTAAHIHMGAPGQNGPVVVTLVRDGANNVWMVPADTTLTPEQYEAYWAGQLYVNVHSAAHSSGEIRAQLRP